LTTVNKEILLKESLDAIAPMNDTKHYVLGTELFSNRMNDDLIAPRNILELCLPRSNIYETKTWRHLISI